MRRTIILAGVLPFVSAFLGGILAVSLAVPLAVGAQETRIQAEQLTIIGDNGAERITLRTGPGINARVQLADANGVQRAIVGTGGPAGNIPDDAGFNLFAPDGVTQVMRLGMGRGPTGDQPLATFLELRDGQGQPRIALRLDENGEPSMQLFDASRNLIWSAP